MKKPSVKILITLLDLDKAPACFVRPDYAKGARYLALANEASASDQVAVDVQTVRTFLSSMKGIADADEAFERIAARLGVPDHPLTFSAGNTIMGTILDAVDEAIVSIAG